MKLSRRACTGMLGLLLAGCATPRTPPADPHAYWTGRLALQVQSDPPQSLSAAFELQGSATQGEMLLLSPIGTTLARLVWTRQNAWLEQGDQRIESPDLQSLSARLTGTTLPVPALFEWLAGRSADADGWHGDLSAHAQGRITANRVTPAPQAVLRILLER